MNSNIVIHLFKKSNLKKKKFKPQAPSEGADNSQR